MSPGRQVCVLRSIDDGALGRDVAAHDLAHALALDHDRGRAEHGARDRVDQMAAVQSGDAGAGAATSSARDARAAAAHDKGAGRAREQLPACTF